MLGMRRARLYQFILYMFNKQIKKQNQSNSKQKQKTNP